MKKVDKDILILFVTRTGMFINPRNKENIVSFLHGFLIGTKNKSLFIDQVKNKLEVKYKIRYLSDGWSGQIDRLSKKQKSKWEITFKKVAIEVLIEHKSEAYDKNIGKIIKKNVIENIAKISSDNKWFSIKDWVDEWSYLCDFKSVWFKKIWTDEEWLIIKSINKIIHSDKAFKIDKFLKAVPTEELVELKEELIKKHEPLTDSLLKEQVTALK